MDPITVIQGSEFSFSYEDIVVKEPVGCYSDGTEIADESYFLDQAES